MTNIFQSEGITDRFICPVCQHKAIYNGSVINCTNIDCSMEFPIIDNIPILINENDSVFSINDFISKVDTPSKLKKDVKKIKKNISSFLPSLSNNLSSKKNFLLLEKLLLKFRTPETA